MTTFRLVAKREISYEFEIEASSESEAIEEMNRIDESENTEEYAFSWQPFQIIEIEVFEE